MRPFERPIATLTAAAAATLILGCQSPPRAEGGVQPGARSVAGTLRDIKCIAAQGKDLAGVLKKDGDIGVSDAAGCNGSEAPSAAGSARPSVPVVPPRPPVVAQCGLPHSIAIENLESWPGTLRDGSGIEGIRVTYRTDRNGECKTRFVVRDSAHAVLATVLVDQLQPGTHAITLPVARNYRFSARSGCFTVIANAIATTNTPVDASRTECARLLKGSKPAAYSLSV